MHLCPQELTLISGLATCVAFGWRWFHVWLWGRK